MTREEKNKNRIIAASMTAGITGLLLLLVIMIVWGEPNPPLEGRDGVELNFGLDNEGFGDVQPTEPVGSEGKQAAVPQQAEPQPPKQEAPQPEPEKPSEQLTSEDEESPVITKEKEKEKKKEDKKEPEKPVEKVTTPPKKEQPVTQPQKTDPNAVYNPTASNTKSEAGNKGAEGNDGKTGKPGNHGDDPGKTGDKGNPQGSLDAKALYGTPGGGSGGGGGSSLDLSGWTWDTKPSPNVPNNESGRLVFEIKVDENGDIISIKTLERSVSTEAEQICRKSVEKLTFSKLGSSVPSVSTGRITFVVRAR